MKHSIAVFWSRKWIWIVMLASLPLAPWIVKVSGTYDIQDKLNAVNVRANKALRARYGPDVSQQIAELTHSTTGTALIKAGAGIRSILYPDLIGFAPGASDALSSLQSRFGQYLDDYTSVSRSGGMYNHAPGVYSRYVYVRDDPQMILENMTIPDLVNRLQTLLSVNLLSSGDWRGAINCAEKAAHAADAFRANKPAYLDETVRLRQSAYDGYELMLRSQPNAAVSRDIVTSLRGLAPSDPVLDILTIASIWGTQINENNRIYRNSIYGQAIMNFLYDSRSFHNSANRKWAAFVQKESTTCFLVPLPWTQLRAALVRLRHVVNTEPACLASVVARDPLFEGTDPITRAVYIYQLPNVRLYALDMRGLATKRLLLEAAFAARAWHEEHTSWPAQLADLVPAYLPNLPTAPASNVTTQTLGMAEAMALSGTPYLPLQSGWIELTPNHIMGFLGFPDITTCDYDIANWHCGPMDDGSRHVGFTIWMRNYSINPLSLVLYAEALERRPSGSVKLATVLGTPEKQSPQMMSPGMMGESASSADAEKMTSEKTMIHIDLDKARLTGMATNAWMNLCQHADVETTQIMAADFQAPYALKVDMVLPEKVFAIWAPGADQAPPAKCGSPNSVPTSGLIVYPEGL